MNRFGIIPAALVSLLSACSSMPTPEPRLVTVPVDRLVQMKCADNRPPSDIYPDTDDKVTAIAEDDFERLARVYRAGRDLRDARIAIDDVQIKTCVGE
jgi:hypothetical protein